MNTPVFTHKDTIVDSLLHVTRSLLFPSFFFLNGLLITHIITFEDRKQGNVSIFQRIIYALVYFVLFCLSLPLSIIFLPLRIILLYIKRPYQYSIKFTPYTKTQSENCKKKNGSDDLNLSIATANILLLPEYAARFNNMKNVGHRSKEIGERIVIDQFFPRSHLTSSSEIKKEWLKNNIDLQGKLGEVEGKVRSHFSSLDFLCIQEAFSNHYNKTLMNELHKIYPYIVHDVGVHGLTVNRYIFNSGLMLASRYPIVAIDFKAFKNFVWPAEYISQGMLMAKVIIEKEIPEADDYEYVGYIYNVHLQAFEGDNEIIPKQLDEVLEWVEEFELKTKQAKDKVLFNVLCGDFNCDNMSPGDRQNHNHKFFSVYKDFGRIAPGKDKDWTIGTELRQKFMLDPMVRTPDGLKIALEDPSLRRQYILDANLETITHQTTVFDDPSSDAHGNLMPSSVGGKRRIDLINFHSSCPVTMKGYDFVTRLASLTDHIPVQASFSCQVSDERPRNKSTE